jgi:hypothetical protein
MSIIFFDGFDFTQNVYGPGGRLWDQATNAINGGVGRWGGGCVSLGSSTGTTEGIQNGLHKQFTSSRAGVIVGFAVLINSFQGFNSGITEPFMFLGDFQSSVETIQCSVWVNPTTYVIEVRTGYGDQITDTILATTTFVPPLTLWFYIEIAITVGSPGSVEIRVDGATLCNVGGITTQQSSNPTWNIFHLSQMGGLGPSVIVDDFYMIDPNDGLRHTTFLGEVRVQTNYPDADGYENDFLRSTGSVNALNVDGVTNYVETGLYNYNGNVGAIDLYSITPFAITGNIFAVQEHMSVRRDNTGSRSVCPLLRLGSTNYQGPDFVCYSSYTYMGDIWEYNPATSAPWALVDLNDAEFGIEITS